MRKKRIVYLDLPISLQYILTASSHPAGSEDSGQIEATRISICSSILAELWR